MDTREITTRVDSEAAKAYVAASAEEREKVDLLLSLRLSQVTRTSDSLDQVMRETSEVAQRRGVTEERVREILEHYESQAEEEAVAEDEAAFDDPSQTVMEIPNDLVPDIRSLIAKRRARI